MKIYKYFLILFLIFTIVSLVKAQTADELQNKINDRNNAIAKLEAEIKGYQKEVEAIGKEKDSLSNTLRSLDISKKKLEADTKITENKIAAKNLEIKELSLQIGDKSERIGDGKRVISQSLYNISQMNNASVIETILGKKSFSELWNSADELAMLQGSMQGKIVDLENLKQDLETNKKKTEAKKTELVKLTNELRDQTKIVAENVIEKNAILKETKNSEANYNKLLAQRKAQKEAFEREISALEDALKLTVNQSSLPKAGSGVLRYPLDKVILTQYFGNTAFATQNPQVYKGLGHTGIDFAAPIGTPVKAAASGIVSDVIVASVKGCGYGKWIMLKHSNGLSTLYSHLSLTSVAPQDVVAVGQVIGYSGNTGYTTGPHLHFGVYATEGVQTSASKSCPGVIIPIAVKEAYLNPLSFL